MDWAYTVLTFTRRPHESTMLRKIDFVKVRDGKQPKPFIVERDPETFLCQYHDEDSLVSPAFVKSILDEEFNGMVDGQKEFVKAIMAKAQCSDRTARTGIKRAVELKQIFEMDQGNGKQKGYRMPMAG